MTFLVDLSVPWAIVVGSQVLLKGSIVVAIAGVVVTVARRVSAASRHAIWGSAIAALLVLPVMTLSLPKMYMSLPTWEIDGASSTNTATTGYAGQFMSGAAHAEYRAVRAAIDDQPSPGSALPGQQHEMSAQGIGSFVEGVPTISLVAFWALTIWAAGVFVLLTGFALSTLRVRAVSRRAMAGESGTRVARRRRIKSRFGIPGSVTVVASDEVSMPVCWGLFNPIVILPNDSDEWPSDRTSAVMFHEIAHATRCDYLAHVLGEIVRAIYWPNPLVWFAVNAAATEREHACDDEALNVGIRSDVYARHLLDVVLSQTSECEFNGAVAMAGRSNLAKRVRKILARGRSRAPVSGRGLAVTGVAAALVAVPIAALEPFEECDASKALAEQVQLQGPRSVQERIQELGSGDPRVRRYAAWALGELEDERGATALHECLGDSEADVRLLAAWALGEIKDERSIDPLIEAFEDDDPLVREMAVLAVGEIEHPRSIDPLIDAFERHEALRWPVIWALGEIDSFDAFVARLTAFQSIGRRPRENTEVWAGEWLGLEEPRRDLDLPTLVRALDDRDPEIRQYAAWALGHLDDERAVESLLDLLRDEDPSVRAMAIWALDETNPSRQTDQVAD